MDGPLADLKVIDCSTVVAGPGCARYLADFGADVVKVERPDGGDGARRMGWVDPRDGETLWWKLLGRGKRCVTLDLKADEGRERMLRLCDEADVLVENFRPGTLERLGLGPSVLLERNPRLVITRVTGFGQDGPYAGRPGFATLAEAMSGFAAVNGEPDGPPLLPPIALTDEVTGLAAAFATMVAVHSGVGQVVDVNLLESMLQLMGPLLSAWRVLGYEQPRLGSGIPYSVPRGTWRTADGRWVALSTSSEGVARRVLALLGLDGDERLATNEGRIAHRAEVDAAVSAWIGARSVEQVLRAFHEAEAAIAPVLTPADAAEDPHLAARGYVVEVDGVPMQGLIARLSATPGRVRWAGRPLGADNAEVFEEPR
ncbi:MAG TPA: CoA transferase [Acidimicrobiales bacterium]|jgi:crotonobetainyl-CoA:carnitine CoA-transferase CaiB-like acyl-CoA transferase|nr:CoA transferase [Acidimicrobiales bacterium]